VSPTIISAAKTNQKNADTSNYHSDLNISNAHMTNSITLPQSNITPVLMQADSLVTTYNIDTNLLHVLWHDDVSGSFDIYHKRDGADFDPSTINLSNSAVAGLNPALAVVGSTVHVVWEDFIDTTGAEDIFYRKSIDGGATFTPPINISDNPSLSHHPAIAVNGNNVYVVWHDESPGNFDIFYRRSTDGGASFVEPTKNLSSNVGDSILSDIAVSGSNISVVWQDDTSGNFDILYRRSINGGSTFPNIIKNLSNNAGFSEFPSIAISGNNVHVVWHNDTAGNRDILYRRSLDGGSTFPDIIKNLSNNAGFSSDPEIAASGNIVHVVWSDNPTGGGPDILYRRSTDAGGSFVEPIKNMSGNNPFTVSDVPDIAAQGANVYVVWGDEIDGNHEILYRKSTNSGGTFPAILSNLSTNSGVSHTPAIAVS
jgi:hypothetical protein